MGRQGKEGMLRDARSCYNECMSHVERLKDRLKNAAHDAAFAQFAPEFHRGGFPAMAEAMFRALHVEPVYLAERRPDFMRMREALRTESGLVIANHPGVVDIPAVFQGLDRKDVRILASEENAHQARRILGSDAFLPVSHDISRLRPVMEEAQAMMRGGGTVFLFPSGGQIASTGAEAPFQSGFRYLLRGLRPDQMVYAFHIYSEDVQHMIPRLSRAKLEAEMIARRFGIPFPNSSQRHTIRIDEEYTNAVWWQDQLRGVEAQRANQLATDVYNRLFGVEGMS